ncbi:hypothetical protein Lser_V15G23531 [Lactuca serriola]
MYSGNAYPSFLSTIDPEQLQLSVAADEQAFGGSIANPMATNIHGQPLWYGNFSNIRMDSHATMDIDSSGGQPPSIGDVRQMVVSEPSGSNQMSSDGQPPSVNDLCRREPSQSEASCNRYEGPDEHEVQQVIISELNDGVYKRGTVGSSNYIDAYAGRFGVPYMAFNSTNSTINNGGLLNSGVWAPPQRPQPIQQMRTYTRVYKRGAIGRSVDITSYSGYNELKQDLAQRFGIEGQLDDQQRFGWKLVYEDHENDILLVGNDPWEEFVICVKSIKILSPQEVQEMSLDGDFGGNNVVPNQACNSPVVEQFNGRLINFF